MRPEPCEAQNPNFYNITSKTEVLQMPSATDVNLDYGVISLIFGSKAKNMVFSNCIFLKIKIFWKF